MLKKGLLIFLMATTVTTAFADNIIDEIVWVVGDEPILKSDVEQAYLSMKMSHIPIEGEPYCVIPEQLAVQKLYLHQADLDSIFVSENEATEMANNRIQGEIARVGSEAKLVEYLGKSIKAYRAEMIPFIQSNLRMRRMQQKIVENIKVTPAEVRTFAKTLPHDSLPLIPEQVEVQIITETPTTPRSEIDRIEGRLRDFTNRINTGETTFSALATLYSQDGSARNGGELPYTPKSGFVPAFANVAFALTDPKKVSRIVKTEYGYHIIQLIDKQGDKIKVRHILLKPEIPTAVYDTTLARLDSVATAIRNNKVSFEEAVSYVSDDKMTRNNRGLMVNIVRDEDGVEVDRQSRFEMRNLPAEIAKVVDTLQVGAISVPFVYTNEKDQQVCAIVKLKERLPQHRANVEQDLQSLTEILMSKHKEEALEKWVRTKIKTTYVRINKNYRNCTFKYQGWIK